jgi:hypothetical protein
MYWSLLSPQKLHFLRKENQMLHKKNNFSRLWNFAKETILRIKPRESSWLEQNFSPFKVLRVS